MSGDPARWPVVGGAGGWTTLQMDSVRTPSGVIAGRFCVDLSDDLYTPGDTIEFYLSARDANGMETYWTESTGATDSQSEAIQAKMEMTCLPANNLHGHEIRPDRPGPVFVQHPERGFLHMRYTARKRNIIWKENAETAHAVKALEDLLNSDSPHIFRATLQAGMGLVSHNILHDRSGFTDDPERPRLLYRARYYNRIADL